MMRPWLGRALAACALSVSVGLGPAQALEIFRDVDFVARNQNPFASGPAQTTEYEQTIPLPTLRTDFPAAIFPLPTAPPTFFQFGASVTGELDLTFAAGLNPGRLNINYPVETKFTVPNALPVGQTFSLGSTAMVTPAGYSQLNTVQIPAGFTGAPRDYLGFVREVVGAPTLTTSNPGAVAWVDLGIENHNFLSLQGCVVLLLATPCTDIYKADLPSLGSTSIRLLTASTDGKLQILPEIPSATITKSLPVTLPLGTFASFTVDKPNLAQTGSLAGADLKASKTSNIATLTLSIDGLVSNALLNPLLLPPLTGSAGPIDYSLLKADASLHGGLFQDLTFTAKQTNVTLVFDSFVRARVNGLDLGAVNVLQFNAGDDVRLSPMGFVTKLHVVPSFSLDNNMHNSTGIALSGELSGSALSASIPGVGSIGPLVKGDKVVPLANLELFHNDFPVDVKPITGAAFDINFGGNPNITGLEVATTRLVQQPDGRALFHFVVTRQGNLIDEFDVAGTDERLSVCPGCDIFNEFFLPDQDVSIVVEGQPVDLGDIFCIAGTCNQQRDLSFLDSLIHEDAVDGFLPVYFADGAQDFQLSDPVLTGLLQGHPASVPDPGQVIANDQALFDAFIHGQVRVPAPSALATFTCGLIALVLRRRRRGPMSPEA